MGLRISKSIFFYCLSEAGNEKYCYELHARSGLRFIIRHDIAKLQYTVVSLGVDGPAEGERMSTKPRYCFLWQVRQSGRRVVRLSP